MQVKDVMTQKVISTEEDETIFRAARLMLQNRISGLPVLNKAGKLVGIVTEGDFLRRSEIGTQKQRPRWLEFIIGPGRLADEYVHASGRKIGEIMTPNPQFVAEDDALEIVAQKMEHHHIKRLPVMRNEQMVGIVSRANLVQALANSAGVNSNASNSDAAPTDETIRGNILTVIGKQNWAVDVEVVVKNGVAQLRGAIFDERQRQALIVGAENVAGVKQVIDHLVWVEPMSAMAILSAQDEAADHTVGS